MRDTCCIFLTSRFNFSFSLGWVGAMQMFCATPSLRQHRRNMTTSCQCLPELTCPPLLLSWGRPSSRAERLPSTSAQPKMSSHKRNFQCFNAVGSDGSHKHHTSTLPRIPQHGMVAHHEPLEECYLCSQYRHTQALEALETQVLPLYHTHTPYHHHHHPHQYVVRRPTMPEEPHVAHSGHERHIHHHRTNKTVVLVKNSDPSFRKTIVLHRRSLRSFGLFLEEVSELMQYHIRKLYTVEGRKVSL